MPADFGELSPKDIGFTAKKPAAAEGAKENPLAQELILREKESWKKILGADIEVAPLPGVLTPERMDKLKDFGMKLVYIPRLDLKDKSALGVKGDDQLEQYLGDLNTRYPNWKNVDDLSNKDKNNAQIPRRFEKWIFEQIRNGKIDFPRLPGQWVAIETIEKFGSKLEHYQSTPFAKTAGLSDIRTDTKPDGSTVELDDKRQGQSPSDVTDALKNNGGHILEQLGIPIDEAEVRLPEIFEANLILNRTDIALGKQPFIHTNTASRTGDSPLQFCVGNHESGGAGAWDRMDPNQIGFNDVIYQGMIFFKNTPGGQPSQNTSS